MVQKNIALKILGLIDLTMLNDNDNAITVSELCKKTTTNFGNVPAICIYRQFIPVAKHYFSANHLPIKIVTVSNFPHGNENLTLALAETQEAITLGADEVDLVFPYKALIDGKPSIGREMIREAKKICSNKTLKVIIESGELKTAKLIHMASMISIEEGADFIKTSTGKVAVNATLEAAEIMLNTIKEMKSPCGFKAAGGIYLVSQAAEYLALTEKIMGIEWINAAKFRFGASSLLNNVLDVLTNRERIVNTNQY